MRQFRINLNELLAQVTPGGVVAAKTALANRRDNLLAIDSQAQHDITWLQQMLGESGADRCKQ